MTALIGAIIVGILIGIVGTNIFQSMPVRPATPPRFFRKLETGELYHYQGRAYLIGGKSPSGLILAPAGRSGQEAWPEKIVEKEFEEITVGQFIEATGHSRVSR